MIEEKVDDNKQHHTHENKFESTEKINCNKANASRNANIDDLLVNIDTGDKYRDLLKSNYESICESNENKMEEGSTIPSDLDEFEKDKSIIASDNDEYVKPSDESTIVDSTYKVIKLDIGQYACSGCHVKERNRSKVQRHINFVHLKFKVECPHCVFQASSPTYMPQHIASVHNGVRYNCTNCKKNFSSRGNLHVHNRENHLKIVYKCQNCSETYKSRFLFLTHLKKNPLCFE